MCFFQEFVHSTNGHNIFRVIDEKRKCLIYENGAACAGISVTLNLTPRHFISVYKFMSKVLSAELISFALKTKTKIYIGHPNQFHSQNHDLSEVNVVHLPRHLSLVVARVGFGWESSANFWAATSLCSRSAHHLRGIMSCTFGLS